jgi:hypothetical protein
MKKNKMVKIGLLTLAICFVIGAVKLVNSIPAVKEALVLATTVKPETFTELYFEDHNNLPKTINRHEEYGFLFTIHNLEYKDMEYPYVVYLQTTDKKIILDENKISLKNGEYISIKEDFGPLKNIRMKITVELVNKSQSIDFWMENQ